MSARDACRVKVAGEKKSLVLSSFKGTPGTFRMPAYSTGGLPPTAWVISAVMFSLGSVLRSVQDAPPSLETKIGAVALAEPPGLGVKADAASSLGLESYSARNGSASCHVSPLSEAGIKSTTRAPTTLPGGCDPCWSAWLQAASMATPTPITLGSMITIYASLRARFTPATNRARVLGVVAVRVEPQAPAEPRLAAGLVVGRAPDEGDQTTVHVVLPRAHLGQRPVPALLGHLGVEPIDAAVRDGIAWGTSPGEHQRQVRQCLLFPPRHVRNDVPDRPGARDPRFHQLGVRQAGIGLPELRPRPLEPLQQLCSAHGPMIGWLASGDASS